MAEIVSPKEFNDFQSIGKGVSAHVYSAWWANPNTGQLTKMAVKVFYKDRQYDNRNYFEEELDKLAKLNHRNVVTFYGQTEYNWSKALVMELARKTLNMYIHEPTRIYSVGAGLNITDDIVAGVKYLHEQNLLHRDLKSSNLLVFDGEEPDSIIIKIADFGLSKDKVTHTTEMTKDRGTIEYIAPEVLEGKENKAKYGLKADVYSVGVIIWVIFSRRRPFNNFTQDNDWRCVKISKAVRKGERPEPRHPENCPDEVQQLIEKCWMQDYKERPQMDVVVDQLNEIKNVLSVDVKARELVINDD